MTAAIETPSGKGERDENFQVGSVLLPARLRPHVMAFYRFVRAADDIADTPTLEPADKLSRLQRFEDALLGERGIELPKAQALGASLAATGVTSRHALDVLAAFKQDAMKGRYRDWPDLMGYCALSASPVGRYLLDLHGEDRALYALSDPLCDALQVLNHLQDCQADYRKLDRVYLPLDAFVAVGIGVDALDAERASPALRAVFEQTLDRTEELLARAQGLPAGLRSGRLAAESAVILAMARQLARALRERDPLATRVELSNARFALVAAGALLRLPVARHRRAAAPAPGALAP